MSKSETKSHVISIRISDAEKRKLDMFAKKRKRKPSNVAKSLVLEGMNQKEITMQDRMQAFNDFQDKMKGYRAIQRDPQEIIDEIRKFRGDES